MAQSPSSAGEVLDSVLRHVLATLAGLLPRRLWSEWEGRIPMARMALASALLAFFLGFGIGIPGFLRYAMGFSGTITDTMIQTAHDVNVGKAPSDAPVRAWGISFFSFVAFAFFTPTGLLATYLVLSGLYRLLAVAVHEPRGDPVLSLLDAGLRRLALKISRDRMIAVREAQEGPAVPDVLLTGKDAGVPEADFVLVASRIKPDWEPGVVVVTSEKWYRIGTPFDRRLAGGLRRLYPLTELAAAEVLRRSVAYELPRLSAYDPVSRTTRLLAGE